MKRRFGIDLLYPVTRYVAALEDKAICPESSVGDGDCQCRYAQTLGLECIVGRPVPNPIYSDIEGTGAAVRDRSHVFLLTLAGVPWQDIATDDTLDAPDLLRIKTGADVDWDLIVGDPDEERLPEDLLMVQSVDPRLGPANPLTGEPPQPPQSDWFANPANGHEWNVGITKNLQYACVFDITSLLGGPRDCEAQDDPEACECYANPEERKKPLCQDPETNEYGVLQYADGARPGLRQLDVVRRLEKGGLVGSICPKVLSTGPEDPSYGYSPALLELASRIGAVLR
jgi:hypothetical protein